MNSKQQFEFAELFERVVNDDATEQQVAKLEELIMTNPDALALYQDMSLQHSHLQMTQGGGAGMTARPQRANRIWQVVAVAALFMFSALLWFQQSGSGTKKEAISPSIAIITSTSLAQWGQCSLPTTSDSALQQGSLVLLRGTATLTFASGAIVSLEAPAEIELVSGMQAIVKHGRVVAEVPEKAIGFRLDTPDLEVKDLGTVFAVSVDRERATSQVDVIDGEVEIFHQQTQNRKLLYTNHRVVTDQGNIDHDTELNSEIVRNSNAADNSDRWTVSTADGAGAHASIFEDQRHRTTLLHPHLIQAKNAIQSGFSRKFYLKFDLSSLGEKKFQHVTLHLNQVQSPYGYASFVSDSEFGVYALLDDEQDDWDAKTLRWANAPANDVNSGFKLKPDEVIQLGDFKIPQGQQEGNCFTASQKLTNAIKKDSNGVITLIVVRKSSESRKEGLVHTFAGNHTPNAEPPRLIFTAE
ncbi:MAG: DNRLRE domain-containing protein [Akkermansiaceae bacterium]